jgi:hypothetical protein
MMRKILVSRGYGAGWSTWNSSPVAEYMLTHEQTIKAIEDGKGLKEAIHALEKECKEKFDEEYVCTLGSKGLSVEEVNGRVRMTEYDGAEGFDEEGSEEGWM